VLLVLPAVSALALAFVQLHLWPLVVGMLEFGGIWLFLLALLLILIGPSGLCLYT
jgi:hypothetical protein